MSKVPGAGGGPTSIVAAFIFMAIGFVLGSACGSGSNSVEGASAMGVVGAVAGFVIYIWLATDPVP